MSQHVARRDDLSQLGEGLELELVIVGMLEECFPSGSPEILVSLNQKLAQWQESGHKMAALTSKSRRRACACQAESKEGTPTTCETVRRTS